MTNIDLLFCYNKRYSQINKFLEYFEVIEIPVYQR